jgi:hypothetical protein
VMHYLQDVFSSVPLHWWAALIISALGIAAICLRAKETDGVRAKRAERNNTKGLRSLAEKISSYGHIVHERYPTGDVIVSERDLAEQLRKRRAHKEVQRVYSPRVGFAWTGDTGFVY